VPPDVYRLTKRQLQHPVRERLRRDRPIFDPQTEEGWARAVADGRIEAYMRRVTGRADRDRRSGVQRTRS
jgi:hypothetical protein